VPQYDNLRITDIAQFVQQHREIAPYFPIDKEMVKIPK
jgi:hypothetical protein